MYLCTLCTGHKLRLSGGLLISIGGVCDPRLVVLSTDEKVSMHLFSQIFRSPVFIECKVCPRCPVTKASNMHVRCVSSFKSRASVHPRLSRHLSTVLLTPHISAYLGNYGLLLIAPFTNLYTTG